MLFGLSDEAETYKTKKIALRPDALHKSALLPLFNVHLCQEKNIIHFKGVFFLISGIKCVILTGGLKHIFFFFHTCTQVHIY